MPDGERQQRKSLDRVIKTYTPFLEDQFLVDVSVRVKLHLSFYLQFFVAAKTFGFIRTLPSISQFSPFWSFQWFLARIIQMPSRKSPLILDKEKLCNALIRAQGNASFWWKGKPATRNGVMSRAFSIVWPGGLLSYRIKNELVCHIGVWHVTWVTYPLESGEWLGVEVNAGFSALERKDSGCGVFSEASVAGVRNLVLSSWKQTAANILCWQHQQFHVDNGKRNDQQEKTKLMSSWWHRHKKSFESNHKFFQRHTFGSKETEFVHFVRWPKQNTRYLNEMFRTGVVESGRWWWLGIVVLVAVLVLLGRTTAALDRRLPASCKDKQQFIDYPLSWADPPGTFGLNHANERHALLQLFSEILYMNSCPSKRSGGRTEVCIYTPWFIIYA